MAGFNAPITTGNGVYWLPGTVGAGPDIETANGYLENRITNEKLPLWIYDFSADFSATGMEAQSRLRKEFYPRFFTQPRYVIKGQTPNQYEYQRLGTFIRKGMLAQVTSTSGTGNAFFEAFVLRVEGRGVDYRPRTTKGGHAGWTLEGYIEEAPAGGERFKFAPEYEFTFVLANATEGPMQVLDTTYIPQRIASVREAFLASFGDAIPKPDQPAIHAILDAYGDDNEK